MLADKYKIEVSFPGQGLAQTYPLNSTFEWSWEKEQGQIYYRKKLATNLIFKDNPELLAHDFGKLYLIERSRQSRCDKVDVIVSKRCSKTDAWTQHYTGYLSMIDGKWNESLCEVEIPITPQDQYTCLYENWERDLNILNLPGLDNDSRSTFGVIEYRPCSRTTFTDIDSYSLPTIPAFAGNTGCVDETEMNDGKWTLVRWEIFQGSHVNTEWAREVFIGPSPGIGWTNIEGDKWVRPVEVVEDQTSFFNDGSRFFKQWKIVQYQLTNGLKLSEVLPKMVEQLSTCQYTIKSNFFGIAPDGTAPTNRPYSKAFDHARNLLIYDLADVKRAKEKVDQSSFILNVSFKRMLENLQAMFNVYFLIEENTNIIRLEHISYFQDKRMLDLTQERFLADIKGRWKYTYDKIKRPLREDFKFMSNVELFYDFDAIPIEYEYPCSNKDRDTNEVTITADYSLTAVDDIVEHPDKYPAKGMVFIERHAFGYIVTGLARNNFAQRNGNLSWFSLMDFYHRHGRPQQYGNLNGQETRFNSFKRTRKQDPIQIQLCCSDFVNFNPQDLVRTQLGWGEIVTAKYSEPSEVLTVELLHD